MRNYKKLISILLFAVIALSAHAQLADIKAQIDHMAKGNRAIGTMVTNITITDTDGNCGSIVSAVRVLYDG